MNSRKKDRLGETRVMNNGEKATIIKYNKALDITVQFEDGTIVENRQYNQFKNGLMVSKKIQYKDIRVGEERIMTNGMKAKIIRYGNSQDIDVLFEDGSIKCHRSYDNFKHGSVGANTFFVNQRANREGMKKVMKNGKEATIIKYKTALNITVKLEDGTILEDETYRRFKTGEITGYKSFVKTQSRVGETRKMNCGRIATIIAYRSSRDIDVQFDIGKIIKNRTYYEFLKGNISGEKKRYAKKRESA